ncbi:hypothetical protein [Streptomyces sp. NPDC026673]|uniref:hypothetical protein n=1 Tax=Streptomyces sp. NPDC026673 TaxID=3155724 RepID=UPI0033C17F15
MDFSTGVDQDAVLRARTMLLGSGRLTARQKVAAYRVLAEVSPLSYLPKLSEALIAHGYDEEFRDRPQERLALHEEAAVAARRIAPAEPGRTKALLDALGAYEHGLYSAGRRTEGLAVCEEMAAAGRLGFELGQVPSPVYGHTRLAVVLAEEGRHREAAEICEGFVRGSGSDGDDDVSFWSTVAWVAELEAAGLRDAALDALVPLLDFLRRRLDEDHTSLAIVTWTLVRHSQMLDEGGRPAEAAEARREALTLLAELDLTGERQSWSNIQTWWTTLYLLSGRALEPSGAPGAPAPPYGRHVMHWSPDVSRAYAAELPGLEAEVAALTEAAAAEPGRHLPALVAAHRRLTVRAALRWERRTHRILKPLRPLFAEGVTLARRLAALPGAQRGEEALGRALADRSMFLLAALQYGEAYDDFREAVALLD